MGLFDGLTKFEICLNLHSLPYGQCPVSAQGLQIPFCCDVLELVVFGAFKGPFPNLENTLARCCVESPPLFSLL